MIGDRIPNQTLNLAESYISHWTYLHGLREYYQNFMDACLEKDIESNLLVKSTPNAQTIRYTQAKRIGLKIVEIKSNYIQYNKNKQTLVFENQKSFSIKCMLMGCSQKGPEALGQFGQGMKISMIVLLKADKYVKIQSGQTAFYPTLKPWDHNEFYKGKFDKNVLYIKYGSSTSTKQKTRVTISNITSAEFEEFKYLALPLLDQTIYQTIVCGKSTLIFTEDPKLKGKVYKKGVRLDIKNPSDGTELFKDYSYNFDTIEVGRDRDCANNVWDLYKLQSLLHFEVCCLNFDQVFKQNYPEFRQKLRDHFQIIYKYLQGNNYQTHYFYTFSSKRKDVCDLFYKRFLQLHNTTQLYPAVSNVSASIQQKLQKYGLSNQFYPVVYMNHQLYNVLIYSSLFISIDNKINAKIVTIPARNMKDQQAGVVNNLKSLIGTLLPQINEFQFKIKQLKGLSCYKEQKIIYISADDVKNKESLKRQLLKMILLKN